MKKKQRGGPRPGSGRKPTGRKAYTVTMLETCHAEMKKCAKASGFRTIGELLEWRFEPSTVHLNPRKLKSREARKK